MRRQTCLFIAAALFCLALIQAQQPPNSGNSGGANSGMPPIRKINITHYDDMGLDVNITPDAIRIIGNVSFKHDSITMTCDSAYYYENANTMDAFGHVHITKNDSSTVDGDYARYQGNISFAEIWDNVVLQDSDAIMKTPHLSYDLTTNVAYYTDSAEIFNKGNDMTSKRGYYHRNINTFFFKKDVVLHTPDYNIYTDSLKYNVQTKVADFVGPTHVITTKEAKDTIYCELGWYDTNDTIALFRQNAWIKSGSSTVNADTLYYERKNSRGRALSHIQIVDTANDVVLLGHKSFFNNLTDEAWMTIEAEMRMIGKDDTLYMHADTLRSVKDTDDFKIMRAYHHTKFFSRDMQGMCDSLAVTMRDSVIHMFYSPVLWAQDNQMTATNIEIETKNKHPMKMNLLGKGFITSEVDSTGFNQISGSKVIGYFKPNSNELNIIDVENNAKAVYYMQEDDGFITGANKTDGTNMKIWLENKKVDEIGAYTTITGVVIPVNEFSASELTLSGFAWWEKHKPLVRDDIFHWGARADASGDSVADATKNVRNLDTLRFRLNRLIEEMPSGVIGIAFRGSDEKDTLTVNGNRLFPMADVYKVYIALAVMRLVDFGTLRLNQPVPFAKEDLRPYADSPLRKEYSGGSNKVTLNELLEFMLSQNDNNATNLIIKLMKGTKRIEQIVKSMGVTPVTIAVGPEQMAADSSLCRNNTTTPYAALEAVDILHRTDILGANSRANIKRMMTMASTGYDKMRAKLSRTAVIGHKTGSIARNAEGVKIADTDVGFFEMSNNDTVEQRENRYFELVVFVESSTENDKQINEMIADIALTVWEYYK